MTLARADVSDAARRMLSRYSSAHVAATMAWFHAMDHAPGTEHHEYWKAVRTEIVRLGSAKGDG